MMYQIEFKQSAKKELARLPRAVAEKVVERVAGDGEWVYLIQWRSRIKA